MPQNGSNNFAVKKIIPSKGEGVGVFIPLQSLAESCSWRWVSIPGYVWNARLADWPCVVLGKALRHKGADSSSWKSVENRSG